MKIRKRKLLLRCPRDALAMASSAPLIFMMQITVHILVHSLSLYIQSTLYGSTTSNRASTFTYTRPTSAGNLSKANHKWLFLFVVVVCDERQSFGWPPMGTNEKKKKMHKVFPLSNRVKKCSVGLNRNKKHRKLDQCVSCMAHEPEDENDGCKWERRRTS